MSENDTPDVRQLHRAIDQLCHEIADLRHLVAALTLIIYDGCGTDYVEDYDAMVDWAFEEFDPGILRESLSEYISEPKPVGPSKSLETEPAVPLSVSQQHLFPREDSNDDATDQ